MNHNRLDEKIDQINNVILLPPSLLEDLIFHLLVKVLPAHTLIGITFDEDVLFQVVHNLRCNSNMLIGIIQIFYIKFEYLLLILKELLINTLV